MYIFLTILFLTVSLCGNGILCKISNKDSVGKEYYQFLELLSDTYALLEQTLIEVFVSTISFTYPGIVNSF